MHDIPMQGPPVASVLGTTPRLSVLVEAIPLVEVDNNMLTYYLFGYRFTRLRY